MKSLTGVILVCIFLTACGGETQEAERKSNVQENETVSITTIEQTAEQSQETTQEAEEFVQTDTKITPVRLFICQYFLLVFILQSPNL